LLLRLSEGPDPTVTARLPLLGNTDNSHCAGKAAHGHILVADTHINFPIERTTERSWRGRSPYLSYNRLLLAGPTCRGPAQCKHFPLSIKGRVYSLGNEVPSQAYRRSRFTSTLKQYSSKVDVGYYAPAARTTLNPRVLPVFIRSSIKRS
jgi:hypothetical protein